MKPQANAQHSPFSLQAMRLPFPTDWAAVFGRSAPLIVEIGFGDGRFLQGLAQQNPQHNILGIERAHSPMTWTEARVIKQQLDNVRLVYGEAYMSLRCLFQAASVRDFHLNFSDPWFKRRHHDRRLIDQEFLQTLVHRLEAGGNLYIATDILEYAEQINAALHASPGLQNAYAQRGDWINQRENAPIATKYERKAQRIGRQCYYFSYQRTAEAVPAPAPVNVEDEQMPNASLDIPLSLEEIAARFQQMTQRSAERVVNFRAMFRDVQRPVLVVETFIDEPLFTQHLTLRVEHRQTGDYLVQLGKVGFPRATPGAQDAVYYLATWLAGLHPAGKIREMKVRPPDSNADPA